MEAIPMQSQMTGADKSWRKAFIAFSALIFIILPLLSRAYGQTGDEWLQILYGRDIWDYFFNGDPQATLYDIVAPRYKGMEAQFQGMHLYGGLYDFVTEALHRWFPSIPRLILRHFCNALTSAALMISTGLIARRMSGKWQVGFLALLLIFFSPRIFGEGMNNPKDIPFAAGFALAVYGFLAMLQDGTQKLVRHTVLLALGFGLAFGVRAAGGMLFGVYLVAMAVLYLFFNKDRREAITSNKSTRNKLIIYTIGALVIGFIIGLSAWPYGLQSPISHPIESLKGMTNREVVIRGLFDGRYYYNYKMPWYYEAKWIIISSPLAVIIGALIFVVLFPRTRKSHGMFVILFLLFGAFFPLAYMVYKHSAVHDTWRHVFFVYPFWVVMAALGWQVIGELILEKMKRKTDVYGKPLTWIYLPIIGLLPAIIYTVKDHPNQGVYFNELVGGVKGAAGNYEMDYYYNSSAQDVAWIRKNVPRIPGKKVKILSNMGGFGPDCFLGDTAFVYLDYRRYSQRDTRDWDYYILFPRNISDGLIKNKTWLPASTVFVAKAGGAPLSAIIKRQSTDDMAAAKALDAKDFPTAIQLYGNYLKVVPDDQTALMKYAIALASANQMDPAIAALQNVTQRDPEDAQAWDILAQLYSGKGNNAAAQDAHSKAAAISAEQQEAAARDDEE